MSDRITDTTLAPTGRAFSSFTQWANKAATWLRPGDVCVDARGRVCSRGEHFMRARDEGAFPVAIRRPSHVREFPA